MRDFRIFAISLVSTQSENLTPLCDISDLIVRVAERSLIDLSSTEANESRKFRMLFFLIIGEGLTELRNDDSGMVEIGLRFGSGCCYLSGWFRCVLGK
jgi:hypothetical protein